VQQGFSAAPLQALPALTDLQLDIASYAWSDKLVAELRALPHLRRAAFFSGCSRPQVLAQLLATPHRLQWQDLGPTALRFDAKFAQLYVQLPSLTRLHGWTDGEQDFDFVARLPHLTALRLDCAGPMERLLAAAGAGHLARLQELDLCQTYIDARVSAAPMVALLTGLPLLHTLSLSSWCGVDSLQPLCALPVLAAALRHLRLVLVCAGRWQLQAEEAEHLRQLRGLESLSLHGVISLTDAQVAAFQQRPSPILPRLQHFEYQPPDDVPEE